MATQFDKRFASDAFVDAKNLINSREPDQGFQRNGHRFGGIVDDDFGLRETTRFQSPVRIRDGGFQFEGAIAGVNGWAEPRDRGGKYGVGPRVHAHLDRLADLDLRTEPLGNPGAEFQDTVDDQFEHGS